MLSPERLFQIDRRAADATGVKSFFGNLLVRLSGDFLQLPPVRSSTLASSAALPRTSTSRLDHESDDSSGDDQTSEERKQGLAKWSQIENVVCLTRVVRAPNALGALCAHTRHCKITDDVWTLLQSRVLRPNDPRLQSPLWAQHPLKVIVQRHILRVSMSNAATLEHAEKMSCPVYVVAARDDVESAVPETVAEIKDLLQKKASFKQTGKRQSLLLLYEGARMLLDGKLCAMLGLMNGTEVVIEKKYCMTRTVLGLMTISGNRGTSVH